MAPDLYDGKTFASLDEGVGYAKQVGFGTIGERCRLAAESLPNALVYAGFSLGVIPPNQWRREPRREHDHSGITPEKPPVDLRVGS